MNSTLASTALFSAGLLAADRFWRGIVEERGVDILEVFEFPSRDFLIDENFDGFRVVEFVGGQDRERVTLCAGATGSADAVDVVFGIFRDAVVDDVGNAGNVDSAGGDVGGDEDFEITVFETGERFHPIDLIDVRVHRGDFRLTGRFDERGELVGFLARAGENHHRVIIGLLEEFQKQLVALVHGDRVKSVSHAGRDRGAGDFDAGWLDEAPLGERLDRRWHGSREKQRLAAFPWAEVDDFSDLREETHVEHAIDFVQNEHFDFTKTHRGAVKVIDEAAWGGDDDIGTGREIFGLFSKADASVEERDFQTGVFAVFFELFGDLVGKFAGRFEDKDLRFSEFFDLGKGRKSESGSLTGTGLGRADDVASFKNNRNGLRLNRGWCVITGFLNGFQNGCGEPKCIKSHAGAVLNAGTGRVKVRLEKDRLRWNKADLAKPVRDSGGVRLPLTGIPSSATTS